MASPYTSFVSSVLFPIHERLKGHDTVQRRRFLERSQWWPSEKLERFRAERLHRFLGRAVREVPYYREAFADVDVGSISSPAGLRELPFLTKDRIRRNLEKLKSENAGSVTLFNTGGSTGEPLQFYIGRARVSHDVAAKWRATRWWGVDIGDPEIVVWGSPIELGAQDTVRELRDRLLRTKLLPAFQMSEAELDRFVATIRRTKPKMLFGYPSAFAHIAEHARARSVDLGSSGVEVAFVTAEQLYEDQRQTIAEGFACQVANGYGGRDLGFAAHECPDGGMHINAEDVLIEIVDERGRVRPVGEEGEIVVTHLATRDFPFIRYRTGDVAALSNRACPCGRTLTLLDTIQGRTTDLVVSDDGTVMHALALIYAIRDVPGVRTFKIIQEDLTHTRVLLVTEDGFAPEKLLEIRGRLQARLGASVRISMEEVDAIPRSRSGKHRYVESKVPVTGRDAGARAPASSVPTP